MAHQFPTYVVDQGLIWRLQSDPHAHSQFTWYPNKFRRKGRLVVGKVGPLRQDIITLWHATPLGGHYGIEATLKRLLTLLYWKGMRKNVKVFGQNCDLCQKNAKGWYDCLHMAEFWYDTCHHSVIELTPYETRYGRPPQLHLPHMPSESSSSEVDNTLINKELKLQLLRHHLIRAQLRMKEHFDKHRSDKKTPHYKLTAKYYGPF
ncbi:hypothetical protein KY289_026672 [Solanum tuberosum]|nr:hypothetical protein KY289_026672 [Solanum tuberosum]